MGAGKKLWGWYPTTSTWIPLQVDADGKVVVDMSAIHKLQDADGDTYLWVEKTADEDKIHGVVKGVEAFTIHDDGIVDFPKQSAARAYRATSIQPIPTHTSIRIKLNAEDYDEQNEFDTTAVIGTADATVANKLHDTGKFTEAAAYYVDRQVINTNDSTYAVVTAKDSNDQLSIDNNIMVNGEGYHLYFSRFTAKKAGRYLVAGFIGWFNAPQDKRYITMIYKNGVAEIRAIQIPGGTIVGYPLIGLTDIVELDVGDYLELWGYHEAGIALSVRFANKQTRLAIQKVG